MAARDYRTAISHSLLLEQLLKAGVLLRRLKHPEFARDVDQLPRDVVEEFEAVAPGPGNVAGGGQQEVRRQGSIVLEKDDGADLKLAAPNTRHCGARKFPICHDRQALPENAHDEVACRVESRLLPAPRLVWGWVARRLFRPFEVFEGGAIDVRMVPAICGCEQKVGQPIWWRAVEVEVEIKCRLEGSGWGRDDLDNDFVGPRPFQFSDRKRGPAPHQGARKNRPILGEGDALGEVVCEEVFGVLALNNNLVVEDAVLLGLVLMKVEVVGFRQRGLGEKDVVVPFSYLREFPALDFDHGLADKVGEFMRDMPALVKCVGHELAVGLPDVPVLAVVQREAEGLGVHADLLEGLSADVDLAHGEGIRRPVDPDGHAVARAEEDGDCILQARAEVADGGVGFFDRHALKADAVQVKKPVVDEEGFHSWFLSG